MPGKKPVKSRSRDPEQTRAKLVESFLQLCAEQGVARVTLQQTAKAAKVPFATAHHHFGGDRGDLRTETSRAVGLHAQTFIAGWVERAAAAGQNPLRAYIFGSFEWARLHPERAGFWVYHYHVLSFHPEKRAEHTRIIEVAQGRIQRLLLEAIGAGIYPAGAGTPVVCHNIHCVLIGSMILAITNPASGAFEHHASTAWAGIETWLRQNPGEF